MMLPRDESTAVGHATLSASDKDALDRFMADNPQLIPVRWDGRGTFCDQFWHVAFLNHREQPRGMAEIRRYGVGVLGGENKICCYGRAPLESCVYDHSELWQDSATLDLVHIAHPYCDGADEGFQSSAKALAARGLNTRMVAQSWYYPGRTNLVVVARPRTLDRISVSPVVQDLDWEGWKNDWESERIVAMQKAGEQVDADRFLAMAKEAEADGNYQRAIQILGDTAHTERTGRFHRQAVARLRGVGRLLRDHYTLTVLGVSLGSWQTTAEVRMVFGFAGLPVPDWLERIWRNSRRPEHWKFRAERRDNDWDEYNRCVVCEEWMESGKDEADYYPHLSAHMHASDACLPELTGLPPEAFDTVGGPAQLRGAVAS